MNAPYSQLRAMLAITRGSLRAIFRSPSAVVFSIGFPLVFILVFGFIGGNRGLQLDVAIGRQSDTLNEVYRAIQQVPGLRFAALSDNQVHESLERGSLTAIIDIEKSSRPAYTIRLRSSEAVNPQNLQVLQAILNSVVLNLDSNTTQLARIAPEIKKIPGREYRQIDFILPGQLGFSLLSAAVFGVAFLFFNLRQQLILKRFFATPIRRTYIVLGEALSRVIFQMFTAIIIVGAGALLFHFTLVHGWVTFLEILLLSFIALLVFMGFGFVVSGLAKNESTIPPFANIFTLPQFLLAGTFFPITVFPHWLQVFCNVLPLTHFNNAMREISFEGASLLSTWPDIGVLLIWGVVIYAVAIRVFRWE